VKRRILQSVFGEVGTVIIDLREGEIIQVSSSNGSLQKQIFSGTGSIGGIHLPDFNNKYVYSKKKSYTSEVSPDRKGIITSGLKAVSKNRQNVLKPIDFVATLLEGKVECQKLPSGVQPKDWKGIIQEGMEAV